MGRTTVVSGTARVRAYVGGGSGQNPPPAARAALWRALASSGWILHYQPIVELQSGLVRHYEALIRLRAARAGALLAPAPFLRAAERYGMARELDRRVLTAALQDAARSGAHLAVNLSALSVTDPALPPFLEETLTRWGLPGERLVVEITETAAIADLRRARAFCKWVRGLGVRVAFDDFGVGSNSLQYVTDLPFDLIKIDGRFIRRLARSRSDRVVVRAVVELARGLEKETVAEYVSDAGTVDLLLALGVDHAQGFALGRPRPAPLLLPS